MVAELSIQAREATPAAISARWAHGGKNLKPEDFNPFHQMLLVLEARRDIPAHSAQVFKRLKESGHLPSWAIRNCDMDKILRAASG